MALPKQSGFNFHDHAADPAAIGDFQRSGNNLKFKDSAGAKIVALDVAGVVHTAATYTLTLANTWYDLLTDSIDVKAGDIFLLTGSYQLFPASVCTAFIRFNIAGTAVPPADPIGDYGYYLGALSSYNMQFTTVWVATATATMAFKLQGMCNHAAKVAWNARFGIVRLGNVAL